MTTVELLLDQPDWQCVVRSKNFGSTDQAGRLRVWRDESDRLTAMLSLRGGRPDQPGTLDDDGCEIPDRIRARFPDHDIEIFAYEHSWWGDHACYYRAGRAGEGTQRWARVDGQVLSERLGEVFVYDENADDRPGGT